MIIDNLFNRSGQQEFTWQSKHIKFFLDLKGIGPSAVEKIIEINPDIEQWDREYVASQSTNYEKTMHLLKDIEEIPSLKELNIEKSTAVVGSRKIIPETAEVVGEFVSKASSLNLSIISGLANGVDEKAHISALENNSKTVAVLPSSLDNILPQSNRGLAKEIVENEGLLITEYQPGSPRNPDKSNYTERNRIQAGLSDLVFIAQSGMPGGTMTTAKHAIDNERKIITYSSKNNIEEYAGNRYLTTPLNESFDFTKMNFTKSQISTLLNKEFLADFIFEDINEINLNSIL